MGPHALLWIPSPIGLSIDTIMDRFSGVRPISLAAVFAVGHVTAVIWWPPSPQYGRMHSYMRSPYNYGFVGAHECQTLSKTQTDRRQESNLVHFSLKCDILWQYYTDFPVCIVTTVYMCTQKTPLRSVMVSAAAVIRTVRLAAILRWTTRPVRSGSMESAFGRDAMPSATAGRSLSGIAPAWLICIRKLPS